MQSDNLAPQQYLESLCGGFFVSAETWTAIAAGAAVISAAIALAVAIATNRRLNRVESSDLKRQATSLLNEIAISGEHTLALISHAKRSRHAVMVASGRGRSGHAELYDADTDAATVEGLIADAQRRETAGKPLAEFGELIADLDKSAREIAALKERYTERFAEDDRILDRIGHTHGL